jgi:hypothetical protein
MNPAPEKPNQGSQPETEVDGKSILVIIEGPGERTVRPRRPNVPLDPPRFQPPQKPGQEPEPPRDDEPKQPES